MNRLLSLIMLLALAPFARAMQPDVSAWARQQGAQEHRATLEIVTDVERSIESHSRSWTLRYALYQTFVPDSPARVTHGPMHIDGREVDARRVARLDPMRKLPPLQRTAARHATPAQAVARLRLTGEPTREGKFWRYDFAFPPPPNATNAPRGPSDSLSLWFYGSRRRPVGAIANPAGASQSERAADRRSDVCAARWTRPRRLAPHARRVRDGAQRPRLFVPHRRDAARARGRAVTIGQRPSHGRAQT